MRQNSEHRMENASPQPRSARELVLEFEAEERLPQGELLKFEGVGNKDVYNITAPFEVDGRSYIAGRVESRNASDSEVHFFEERNGVWIPALDAPTFQLEDPFVARIDRELIFGGVETFPFPYPDVIYSGCLGFRTVFYRGTTLQSLKRFAQGPELMKDIRLIERASGEIAVFTRPQRPAIPEGGRGKIGFIEIPNLEALTPDNILKARIIENQFLEEEWGGVNDMYLLEDGQIEIVGHIAYADAAENGELQKHYSAMVFTFDPARRSASPLRIIATRQNFPPGPAKRSPELDDVVFPGGLVRHRDKTVTLYTGLSDTSAGRITIRETLSQSST